MDHIVEEVVGVSVGGGGVGVFSKVSWPVGGGGDVGDVSVGAGGGANPINGCASAPPGGDVVGG
jgi:hypothetical protein